MLNAKQSLIRGTMTFVLLFAFLLTPASASAAPNPNSANTLVTWGYNNFGQTSPPNGLNDIIAIDGGWYHTVAVRADGTVVAWGKNEFGESNVPVGLSNVVAVAAGWHHSVALKADGTVVAWGQNDHGQISVPAGLVGVKAIAAGWHNTVALKEDGTVVAWGSNVYGESTVPPGLAGVTAIATSWAHVLALKEDGSVVGWGIDRPWTDIPEEVTDIVAIDAGGVHSIVLKRDGTLFAWGENEYGQTNIPSGLSDVVAISAGRWHNIALKRNGEIVTWGLNSAGQLNAPSNLKNIAAIATGGEHSMVLIGPGNLLRNASLNKSTVAWKFYTNGTGSFDIESPGFTGAGSGRIAIDSVGGNMQVYQRDLQLEPNTRYRLRFAAKSSRGHDISVYLHKHRSPYTNYGLRNFRVNLTDQWKTFNIEFTAKNFSSLMQDARLRFWLPGMAQAGDTYWLDELSLEKISTGVQAASSNPAYSQIMGTIQGSDTPVKVTLADLDSEGTTYQMTQWISSLGSFSVDEVPFGTYELSVVTPAGHLASESVQLLVSEELNEEIPFTITELPYSVYLPQVMQ